MKTAFVSRFGDRHRADAGCVLRKVGVNCYRLLVEGEAVPHVFAEALTPDRAVTLVPHALGAIKHALRGVERAFDIFTFNLLNGHHPGSDLRVRIFCEGDPELVTCQTGSAPMPLPAVNSDERLLVQVHSRDFRMARVHDRNGRMEVETLITRTPPTPLETDIEIAVVRALGPLDFHGD